jgi:DNA-binding MarR family transcriptional regulator
MHWREVISMNETAKVIGAPVVPGSNDVDRGIVNGLTGLVKRAGAISQSIADRFDIAPSDLLALFKLDEVMTMKELAQHMSCDASFVTTIADTLERRGLARREPSLRDRRVKNLVLTPEGIAAKEQMMQELALRMPWCYALDEKERHVFLALIEKMLAAGTEHADRPDGGEAVTTASAAMS